MAFSHKPTKPLTIIKILHEAFILLTTNCNPILPLLLLYFFTSSLLLAFTYLSIKPTMVDLTSKSISIAYLNPKSPLYPSIQSHILKDIKQLIRVKVILIIVSFVVSSLIAIAMIHALYLTSADNSSNIHDLLNKLHGRVKSPMITRLYVKLMSLGCFFLLLLPPVVIIVYHGSMIYIALGVIQAILGLTLYLYLSLVWSVSVVISVIEDWLLRSRSYIKSWRYHKGEEMARG